MSETYRVVQRCPFGMGVEPRSCEHAVHRSDATWEVQRPTSRRRIAGLSEAEANIIAFALAAVSEGCTLVAQHPEARDFGAMGRLNRHYEGPTKEVLP